VTAGPESAPAPGLVPAVALGTAVLDEGTGRVGEVTGHGDGRLRLRPVRGGRARHRREAGGAGP
jgi:hypothetical protein